MQRLRGAKQIEQDRDIKEVQRDLNLIKSPAIGLKERNAIREKDRESDNDEDKESDNVEDMEGLVEEGGEVTL